MILMLSGTSDGRQIGEKLADAGFKLIMTAVSEYGGDRLPAHDNIETTIGHLDKENMIALIKERDIKLLLDATHPYAVEASVNAIAAAEEAGINYLRYERPDLDNISDENIVYLKSYEDAAAWLKNRNGKVFLTIGSRRLLPFINALDISRLVARVLPTTEVVQLCSDLGLKPSQIIAMQGPFSEAMNEAMFVMHGSKYLVTKASSKIGGFEEKIAAASKKGMTTIVIERPETVYPNVFSHVEDSADIVKKFVIV